MKPARKPFTFDRVVRILFSVAIVAVVLYFVNLLKGALLPFLIAWLLAYMINPFVEFIQHRCKVKVRILAIFVALLTLVAFVWLVVWIITPSIVEEAGKMRTMIDDYLARENSTIPFIPESWHLYLKEKIDFAKISEAMNPEDWRALIERFLQQLWAIFTGSGQSDTQYHRLVYHLPVPYIHTLGLRQNTCRIQSLDTRPLPRQNP